jgi:hypothetical protein
MYILSFLLNLPYTLAGVFLGILSFPKSISIQRSHCAIVINTKSLWWAPNWLKGTRAATVGHTVLISPRVLANDLEHELTHVTQHARAPIVFPILYFKESILYGYRKNKYEEEAYRIAGNPWIEV